MIGVIDEGADLRRRRQQQQAVTHEDEDGFVVAPTPTEKGGDSLTESGKREDMDAPLLDDVHDDDDDDNPRRPSDRHNIAVLLFLYVLQGIPLGLAGSIPLILKSRNASYHDLAAFSLVSWPFSLKILWAPIVDAVYVKSIGRRKTWLVPVQYLLGLFMILLSFQVDDLLGDAVPNTKVSSNETATEESTASGEGDALPVPRPCQIGLLTVYFFVLYFLAATQDIAVDGWALTMLRRRNVGHASTCNTVGQTAGYFLGNVVFLALESADFSNAYLRSEPSSEGLVTLAGFLSFWGIVFLITTTLVMIFKGEKSDARMDPPSPGILSSYSTLLSILRLSSIRSIAVVYLTCKVGFAAVDALTGLKLIEAGVPKERLAMLAVPLTPINILLPLIISRYTAGPRPMDFFLRMIPFRLLLGFWLTLVVWWTPSFKSPVDGSYSLFYYAFIVVSYIFQQIPANTMFVAMMGFSAKISDPRYGGTYMTLLNTIANLGGNWPSTLSLWFVEDLDWTPPSWLCSSCSTIDGYYVESLICMLLGFLWLKLNRRRVQRLQNLDLEAWKIPE